MKRRIFSYSLGRSIFAAILVCAIGVACTGSRRPTIVVRIMPRFEPELPVVAFADPVAAAAPKKICSLIPSCTEWLFAMGIGDRVVGVDRWADFPPAVERLPRLGDLNSVETEKILDLHPDLVLLFERHRPSGVLLERAGLNVAFPPTEASLSIDDGVNDLARLAGVAERGRAVAASIRATIESARTRYAGRPRPRVLVVFERRPSFSVAAKSSFIHTMIEAAGGENVSGDIDSVKHFAYASLEKILDWRPEIIIDLSAGVAGEKECRDIADFWSASYPETAKIFIVPSPVLARPGPRTGDAVLYLARLFHGE